jgi:hypothetical protein
MSARTGTAYVANFGRRRLRSGHRDRCRRAVASGRRGSAVNVGIYSYPTYPTGMVITGSTAVVLDTYGGQVSMFSTRTRHVYAPITAGNYPVAMAISG